MQLVDVFVTIIYLITLYLAVFWLLTLLTEREVFKKKRIRDWPFVSIIIPAYNEEDVIERTLNSVINLDYPREKLKIIVVNDGSTDRTPKIVRDFIRKHKDYNIKLLNQKNAGKWKALNHGLRFVNSEFFAVLDADSIVSKDALKTMLPYFYDESVGAVLPLMKVYTPKNILQKIQWYEYIVNMFYKKLASYINCIHVTPGPFTIYRTKVIKKLGGFKRAFATEDLEIALRLQKHHYKIIQVLETEVYTIAPRDFKGLYKQRYRWNKGSFLNVLSYRKMLFNKEYGDFGLIQLPSVLLTGFLSVSLLLLVLYYSIIKPLYKVIKKLFLTHFDIKTWLESLRFEFNLLDINIYKVIIAITVFLISLTMLYLAHKYTKERITKQGILALMTYFLFYYLILGFIWLFIIKDLIVGRFNSVWEKAR